MYELPQPKPTAQISKHLFYNLCLTYDFDDGTLQEIADMAKVPKNVVDAMFVSVGVRRVDAEKVLTAFSAYTNQTWDFENVKVALMPTFADLHAEHQFNLDILSVSSGVPYVVLDQMLDGHAVSKQDARLVLQMVSLRVGERYTLDTVDVLTLEEERQHE